MHIPIMTKEILDSLISKKGIYVDATLGFGGHSKLILPNVDRLIGIDQDIDALNSVEIDGLTKVKANFRDIDVVLAMLGIDKVAGILADIGMSSHQIDSDRGFSYINNGKLDMRMDRNQNFSAYNVVNNYSEEDLANIIYKYGEERASRRIANKINRIRSTKAIIYSKDLADLIYSLNLNLSSVKRVFQAIRIEVNRELESLEIFLSKAESVLDVGGRLAIMTFHSLEDRIVKNFFANSDKLKKVNNKVIIPSEVEIAQNSRAKPAKLRIAEKISF